VLGVRGGLSRTREQDAVISGDDARVPVLAVQSREELSLASAATSVLSPRAHG
jgi:acetate kinase